MPPLMVQAGPDISLYRRARGRHKRPLVGAPKTIGSEQLHAAIERLAEGILARQERPAELILLGIANGGIELARRLGRRIGAKRVGIIDISFHRDDIGRNPIPKEFVPTQIPGDVDGATVILVDDVLFSGRTVKAALDELFDHGRPAKVELAVLADRGGRMLPLAADYTGLKIVADAGEQVSVTLDTTDSDRDGLRVAPAKKTAAANQR